ncbi:MAG: SCO family protein [Actinobacteria bacterium]|nr:MAG: SCO family protein [Actinomycetota bacterium]
MAERTVRPYRFVLLAAALGTSIGLGLALARGSKAPAAQPPPQLEAQVTWPAGSKPAPPLRLRDQNGAPFSLRALRGRPVLVTFLDSHCRSACPVEGRVLRDVLDRLSATRAVLAVVSVDPWADTRLSARAFGAKAGWKSRWHWLLGNERTLARVWTAYHIAVKRTPGDVLHSTALYVVDTRGDLRAGFLFPFAATSVVRTVQALERG